MSRRGRRRWQPTNGDGVLGILALIVVSVLYQLLSGLSHRWQVGLAVLGASLAIFVIRWAGITAWRRRNQQLMLTDVKALTPINFEYRVKFLLEELGWQDVEHVGGSGDGGVDLRGTYQGDRCIVQCKRYAGRVDPKYLRDLEGARHHEHASRAFLITTGYFTRQGRAWTRGKPIELWDGKELARRIHEQHEASQDPETHQRERKRTRVVASALLALNAIAVLWAVLAPGSGHLTTRAARQEIPPAAPGNEAGTAAPTPTTPQEAVPSPTFIAAGTPEPIGAAPEPRTCGEAMVSGVGALNIRAEPGTSAQKLGDRQAGSVVELLCDEPEDMDGVAWRHVRSGDVEGWMSARFLQVSETASE